MFTIFLLGKVITTVEIDREDIIRVVGNKKVKIK